MERRDFLATCSAMALSGVLGKDPAEPPKQKELEVEVLTAVIGGLAYESIRMCQLEKGDIVRFPGDGECPATYQLIENPKLMDGYQDDAHVYIKYVSFPPGQERWSRRTRWGSAHA